MFNPNDIVAIVQHIAQHDADMKQALEMDTGCPADEVTEEILRKTLSESAIFGLQQYGQLIANRQKVEGRRKRTWKHGGRP